MFYLKATIICATLACVVALTTLELDGDVVYGQTFNLVCLTVNNGSYQTGAFFRSFSSSQPGTRVATIAYLNFSCTTLPASFKNYTYGCSNEGKNMALTVPAENEVEHDTFWRCANQGSANEGNNNVIRLFVNDPVRNVTIENNTVVNVIEGISETFVCESSPCRPSAAIYWMKNGINITDPQVNSRIQEYGTKNITSSNLRFTAVRGDNGSLLVCGAYNGYGTGKLSANVTIIVHYSPVVNNFTSPFKVIQGKPLQVLCSADGNPAPQLTWNPAGEDKVNKSRLYYFAVSRDKAVIHTCTATNNMVPTTGSPQPGSDSKQLVIDVLYSPIVNSFTSPVNVIEGQPLLVMCSADGNPSPQLIWNPAGEDRVNKSRLYYSAVSRDKAVIHTCTATNNMAPTTGSLQPGSDSKELLIDVLYSPIVNSFTSPVKVIQGQPLVVVCSADGNPSPLLTWNPAGEDKVNKSRLYYSAISRDKAVVHTCTATNNMVPTTGSQQIGSDSKELLIDVPYSPVVNNFTSPVKVIQGQPLVVVCSADGNPLPELTWNPVGEDKVNKSRLYYSAISRDKAIVHTCTATNNVVPTTGSQQPGSDSKELIMDVLYSPIVNNFTLPVVVIEGQPLVVVCRADGNPPPQMTWNPAGEDKVNGSRLYYSAVSRNRAFIHTCTATNNMVPTTGSPQTGSDSKELLINVLGPDWEKDILQRGKSGTSPTADSDSDDESPVGEILPQVISHSTVIEHLKEIKEYALQHGGPKILLLCSEMEIHVQTKQLSKTCQQRSIMDFLKNK